MFESVLGLSESELTYARVIGALKVGTPEAAFESDKLDFKSELLKSEEMARFIVSLANANGGVLVFGILEKGEQAFEERPVGLGSEVTRRQQSVTDSIDPPLDSVVWRALPQEGGDGTGLLLISVPQSPLLLHAVTGSKGRRSYFKRVQRQSPAMTHDDIDRAFEERRRRRAQPIGAPVDAHASGLANSRAALVRAREWIRGSGGALYALATPIESAGQIYRGPGEALDKFRDLQRRHVVQLDGQGVLGSEARSRTGRIVGAGHFHFNGAEQPSEVASIDNVGVAAVRIDAGEIGWLVQCSGYNGLKPERIHLELSSYTSDCRILNGVTMLFVCIRELYSTYGVNGRVLLEVGALAGGATLFTAPFANSLHGSRSVLDEDAAVESELTLSDLRDPLKLGRLISHVHQDVLAGFDIRLPPAADDEGVLSLTRLTPESSRPEAGLWTAKGLKVK